MLAPVVNPGSPGHILSLVRSGVANTRPELARHAGLSRSAVALRVDSLVEAGFVVEDGTVESTGGRPATYLRFAQDAGVVLVVDSGVTIARLAVTDLAGELLATRVTEKAMSVGPVTYLDAVIDEFASLLTEAGRHRSDLWGVGVGLPGPVEHSTGRTVSPPSMPGWHDYPIADHLGSHFEVPVVVENDVNIMAWGEYQTHWGRKVSNLLMVKIADAGIGCGIVASGRLHYGAHGAAGAIGHIRVAGYDHVVCRCGNAGCLGAAVGGEGLARRVSERGFAATGGRDVAALALAGNIEAIHEVRSCGRALGEVLAGIVNFFNPEVIVIGGTVGRAHEQIIAGLREVIYQRCLPLATMDLRFAPWSLGDDGGVIGAAALTLDRVLEPAAIDLMLKMA
jgi:predicted NBD/HSP70 family sugar kinase